MFIFTTNHIDENEVVTFIVSAYKKMKMKAIMQVYADKLAFMERDSYCVI